MYGKWIANVQERDCDGKFTDYGGKGKTPREQERSNKGTVKGYEGTVDGLRTV
jgi:hypothetical protein